MFSAFEVAGLTLSSVSGVTMEKIGRKNSIVWGFWIMVAGTVLLGCASLIENDIGFFVVSLIARLI